MINSNNIIAQQINSNIISEPNEWSHSWAMSKQRKPTKNNNENGDGETTPLWKKKLTLTGLLEVTMRTKL